MDSDDWKAYRKLGQDKRARNRAEGAKRLKKAGIPFDSKNGGAHLVIADRRNGTSISYWPGTGKWMDHGRGGKGRGVNGLIKHYRCHRCYG